MSPARFEPLTRCPGINGETCDTLLDFSRGELCTACADKQPQPSRNQRKRQHRKGQARVRETRP
jgi:hypothetical protein